MKPGFRGYWRDTVTRADGSRSSTDWRPNLVLWGMADVVAALLVGSSDAGGLVALAVGAGAPDWDAAAPSPTKGRTTLTSEVARLPIGPGDGLTYDPETGQVNVRARFGRGVVAGPLREFGLIGGRGSVRPGTGTLVNHVVHPVVELGVDDTLTRELRLVLDPQWLPGARHLIGSLLARRPGLRGLTHLALGTSADEPDTPSRHLAAEALRLPLDPRELAYDRAAHTVRVTRDLPLGLGPDAVAELGVFGGDSEDRLDTGYVVSRVVPDAPLDRTRPVPLRVRLSVPLVGRLDVAVPDVVGDPSTDAATQLAEAGLAVVQADGPEVDVADIGTVTAQRPPAGASVPEGTPITIDVGRAHRVAVPAVVGLLPDEAAARLTGDNLVVVDERESRVSDRRPGVVDGTVPPPRTMVDEGSAVALILAEPRHVVVPDGRGLLLEAARTALGAAGLVPDADPVPTTGSNAAPGTVVTQDPPAGTDVVVGTEVVLTIAQPWTVPAPDLTGAPLDGVPGLLAASSAELVASLGLPVGTAGLTLGRIDNRPVVDPGLIGTVVDQSPAPGTAVFLYGGIDVTVAVGVRVTVPDLTGLDQPAAAAALSDLGLVLGAMAAKPTPRATGVVAQKPPAGATVPAGTSVAVTLAVAPRRRVPDVMGTVAAVAAEIVNAAGLIVGPPRIEAANAEPGTVLAQEPAAGTELEAGGAVHLTLASGVPEVIGLTEAEARAAIEAAGLQAASTERPSDGPTGIVLDQEPPPGAPADPGSTVTVVISAAADIRVPDLRDLDVEEARARLTEASLVLAGITAEPSDQAPGRVLSHKPPADALVSAGAGVTIVIAAERTEMVDVPELVGRSLKQAIAFLTQLGLEAGDTKLVPDPAVPPGTVVKQKPPAGESVPRGTKVVLAVSGADTTVEVPDFRGRVLSMAVDLGRSVGLVVSAPADADPKTAVVTAQKLPPGARVPVGTSITVQVKSG